LASSSEDQTVRLWDTRTAQAQACVSVIKQDGEALSCALGPNTGLLAVGVEEHVNFFDVRKPAASSDEKNRLGQYANAHTDLVTKVLFHPTQPTTLASGSEDGLVCLYNTGVGQTDEAVVCILNAECPVRDLTFFGTQGDGMAVLTGSEGTSVWHWPSAQRMVQLDDLRYAAGEALGMGKTSKRQEGQVAPPPPPSVFSVQYHYDGGEGRDRLLLAVSDVQGQIAMLQMQPTGHMIPVFQLQGGHQALVRAVDFDFGSNTIVTAGEDARLCLWSTTGGGGGGAVESRSTASPSSSATPPHRQQYHKKQNSHKAKLKKGVAHYHPY
jgi:WD40 repeat protein